MHHHFYHSRQHYCFAEQRLIFFSGERPSEEVYSTESDDKEIPDDVESLTNRVVKDTSVEEARSANIYAKNRAIGRNQDKIEKNAYQAEAREAFKKALNRGMEHREKLAFIEDLNAKYVPLGFFVSPVKGGGLGEYKIVSVQLDPIRNQHDINALMLQGEMRDKNEALRTSSRRSPSRTKLTKERDALRGQFQSERQLSMRSGMRSFRRAPTSGPSGEVGAGGVFDRSPDAVASGVHRAPGDAVRRPSGGVEGSERGSELVAVSSNALRAAEKWKEAKTDAERTAQEGILMMMGVDIAASDLENGKLVGVEQKDRALYFVIGLFLTISAKLAARSENRESSDKKEDDLTKRPDVTTMSAEEKSKEKEKNGKEITDKDAERTGVIKEIEATTLKLSTAADGDKPALNTKIKELKDTLEKITERIKGLKKRQYEVEKGVSSKTSEDGKETVDSLNAKLEFAKIDLLESIKEDGALVDYKKVEEILDAFKISLIGSDNKLVVDVIKLKAINLGPTKIGEVVLEKIGGSDISEAGKTTREFDVASINDIRDIFKKIGASFARD